MKAFVLDASVVMSWCLKDEADDYSESILKSLAMHEPIVPALTPYEVANVLVVAERRGRLTEADTSRFLGLFKALPIRVDERPAVQVMPAIVVLGRQYALSAYDAAYLELAMHTGSRLATRDKTLREAARRCGIRLV